MTAFAKVDIDFSFASGFRKGEFVNNYGAIAFHKVAGVPFPLKVLQQWRPDSARWVEIVGEGETGPHKDIGQMTTMNLYLETSDEVTYFWEPKENAVALDVGGAFGYSPNDLILTSSFKAKPGDAYLLDISKIHSVSRASSSVRKFIQLKWRNVPFSEVQRRLTA